MKSPNEWVDKLMAQMSKEEKIGQLIMAAAYSNRDKKHIVEIEDYIKKYHIGGLIFFQGGPVHQALMTNRFQKKAEIPLLIAMDCEWGLGMRLDSVPSYPYQMMLGAIQNDELIYDMGNAIAENLQRLGVHVSFSPVADVNNNPKNPVINFRSFGENKSNVSRKAYAYMTGLQDNHILAVGKHFPGHGNTSSDSHKELPQLHQSLEQLDSTELYPFRQLIGQGLSSIMTAHLAVSAFDSSGTLPASLSENIIRKLLIDQMKFEGLIITDALNMEGAQIENSKPGDLEVKALLARNDILLMPKDIPKTIKAIKKAIKKGILKQEDIDASCRKILLAKYWAGLNKIEPVKIENLVDDLNQTKYEILKRKLIESSIGMVRNDKGLIPLQRLDTLTIASISIGNQGNSLFQEYLSKYTKVNHFHLNNVFSEYEFNTIKEELDSVNLVIVAVDETSQYASGNYGIAEETIHYIRTLSKEKTVILDLFANPYSLGLWKDSIEADAILISYDDVDPVRELSAQLIFGAFPAIGSLPVSVSEKFPAGTGIISFAKTRLKYGLPEEEGFDPKKLARVDSIALDAINQGATPGCQILIARNGNVVYEKAFGFHTYEKDQEVNINDLYDLASITKIAASLPCIMELTENNKLNLDAGFGEYLPDLKKSNKAKIIMKKALAHQGRLQPWIPFYLNTLENDNLKIALYRKQSEPGFTTQVAERLYILDSYRDSIFRQIVESELRNKEEYKYSDLSYYLFQRIIEKETGMSLNKYVEQEFYVPLGMDYLGYLPLDRFDKSEIVPTELDKLFRKQLVQGYVHDPGAAMEGGVAGHAGLFSNANDLAKLMQMYLNGGEYGGHRFFKASTLNFFNSTPYLKNENRKAIGFDKPEMDFTKDGPTFQGISAESFGHTGFTGTMAWADPDKQIVYIFLSNRVCPDANNIKLIQMNVRTKIQEAIYRAME
ncbi:MAG: serine hydrolase [Bacteroidales bacterium]|nr:serine hydrolase [Bacteroidales bacterium]MCF8454373.1 serine hydrolase [Bacteroidales bacterium]